MSYLTQASEIVIAQELPRGHFPTGAYVSSNRITPDFFSEASEGLREAQVKTGMRFLYSLIHRKLAQALNHADPKDLDDIEGEQLPGLSQPSTSTTASFIDDLASSPGLDENAEDATVMSMENLVYVKGTLADQVSHKLAKTDNNRLPPRYPSCNALPMANALMGYAGGISCQINEWLNCHGMTTSRSSTLQAMEHLRVLQEDRMMELFKLNHKLLPLLIYDNIDIHLKIHNTRIEASSRLFHGTWGFFIVVRSCLQAKCSEEVARLSTFLDAMASADRKTVQMSSFCPTPAEADHWVAVVKAQLAKALAEHVGQISGAPEHANLPTLATQPPPLDPIKMHQANIHFLRMMDAPDSSDEGVSRVIDEVIKQIGLDKTKYAESLLVAGGDVGSNQLLESLRMKRYPPIDSVEGMEWVLSIFGGAHTTWNVTEALLTHHWGKSDNGDDSGAWRSLFALGGEYKKPVASQDFNTIMRSTRLLHKANLVHIIRLVPVAPSTNVSGK
ncbi:uncharacterized protein MELLADRAFT_60250 [Melampsora larici-populina 98AG31]|uniref:DUF6589 domain-containing protein n=1 Tax=Melampsora larici-populina (strain 98AG31 / pathotype 3-4-7) TaxID=747676 RepID=F4RAM8_MELLP|nr:uncharacterized protein MELLADRAFT_60250 [Melampsora larici-populina 98AG31]EGG10756.1 hypothetical protein MELLADRAFT_60250 [Melampsora larici-populina 98AG31]